MNKIPFMLFAAGLCLSVPVYADEQGEELQVQGSYDSSTTSGTSSSNTFIGVSVGHHFTPKLVGKLDWLAYGSDTSGFSTLTETLDVGVKYYFMESERHAWVPFVMGSLGFAVFGTSGTSNDLSGLGTDIRGGGGVSYFLTEAVSMDITLQGYSQSLTITPTYGSSYSQTTNGTNLGVGMTVRF